MKNDINEDVKVVCEVKDKVLDLLHRANQAKEFSMGDVDFLYKAMKTIKDACETKERLENGGYSQGDDWMAEGSYGRGSSFANRGQHWVRGHYSRDGGMDGNYSGRRDSRGRYSHADARADMMDHLEMAVEAAPEEYKDAFRSFMRQMENN